MMKKETKFDRALQLLNQTARMEIQFHASTGSVVKLSQAAL